MRIPRIYTPNQLASNKNILLNKASSHHLLNVLRLKMNDPVILFNGTDLGEYYGKLINIENKLAVIAVANFKSLTTTSNCQIHLGQCISKNERMDFTVQKATELGVTAITPLFCERSEVRLKGERLEKKLQHWQAIMISAAEQSGRCDIPQLNPAMKLTEWVKTIDCELKFYCDTETHEPLPNNVKPKSLAFLIGPEGGLTQTEMACSTQAHFKPLSLGPRVLRTETAGVVALSLFQYLYGDLA